MAEYTFEHEQNIAQIRAEMREAEEKAEKDLAPIREKLNEINEKYGTFYVLYQP
jgi:hypothetical protein